MYVFIIEKIYSMIFLFIFDNNGSKDKISILQNLINLNKKYTFSVIFIIDVLNFV